MNDLIQMNASSTFRFRSVLIAGAISLSLMFGESDAMARGLFPFGRRSSDEDSKTSNKGFNTTIRKLIEEAKSQEEQGNLERAITYADRAKSVSEATSRIVKPASDVAPAVISHYADELRLKLAEQSLHQKKSVPSRGQSPHQDANSNVTADTEGRRPRVKDAKGDYSSDRKALEPSKAVSQRDSQSSANPTPKPSIDRSRADLDKVSLAPRGSSVNSLEANPNDPWNLLTVAYETDAAGSSESVASSTQNQVASKPAAISLSSEQGIDDSSDAIGAIDDALPSVNPMSSIPTIKIPQPTTIRTDTASLKLRTEYAPDISEILQFVGTTAKSPSQVAVKQTDAKVAQAPETQADVEASRQFLLIANDEIDDEEVDAESAAEGIDRTTEELAIGEFPTKQVLELKRRLESVESLEPGAIAPFMSVDDNSVSSAEAPLATPIDEFPVVRLRKRRSPPFGIEKLIGNSSTQTSGKTPIVGRTSMTIWRPAKESLIGNSTSVKPISSAKPAPVELRQSLRESSHSPALEADSSVASPSVDEPPSFDDVNSSLRVRRPLGRNTPPSLPMAVAPLPPPEVSVEQTSFDSPTKPASVRRGHSVQLNFHSDSNRAVENDSALSSNSSESKTKKSGQSNHTNVVNGRGSADDRSESSRAALSNGPIERLAALFRVSNSTASTMVGAAGLVMLIIGLWMARLTARAAKR